MAARENLSGLSWLALHNRREGLTRLLPPLGEVLRGFLMERLLRAPRLQMRSRRTSWASVVFETLDQTHRSGCIVSSDQVEQVRRWIETYHRVKESLEKISDINRELMRRHREQNKKKKKAKA